MRPLSDIQWATFLSEVNVPALGLPPWGGIVEWGNMDVLIYINASSGEVFTTDATGVNIPAISNTPKTYDQNQGIWYYQLPQAIIQTIAGEASQAAALVKQATTTVADIVGSTAAAVTAPLVGQLSPITIIAAVIALFILTKQR